MSGKNKKPTSPKTLNKIDMNEEDLEKVKSKIKKLKKGEEIDFSGQSLRKSDVARFLIKSSEKSAEEFLKIKENEHKNATKISNVVIANLYIWTKEKVVMTEEFGKDITDDVLDSFDN